MDYAKIVLLVQRLITKNGRECTLRKLTAEAADPDKPWKGAGVPDVESSVVVRGVFVPASGEALGHEFISKELLARASEVLLVAPNGTALETYNMLYDNLLQWKIDWCYVLKPADLPLLYAYGVKR